MQLVVLVIGQETEEDGELGGRAGGVARRSAMFCAVGSELGWVCRVI